MNKNACRKVIFNIPDSLKIAAIDRLFVQELMSMRERNLISEQEFLKRFGL